MDTIGKKIYKLRKSKHITQEELSFQLDVSRQTIHNWEAGTMLPSTENIISLCSFFSVNSDYFFNDKEILKETACATVKNKTRGKFVTFIIISILSFIVFIICSIFTVVIGCTLFTNNIGFDSSSTLDYDISEFVILLIISILMLANAVTFTLLTKKYKCKYNLT